MWFEIGRKLVMLTDFEPAGDQPTAIKELTSAINEGEINQVLLGATGTVENVTLSHVALRTTLVLENANATELAPIHEMDPLLALIGPVVTPPTP